MDLCIIYFANLYISPAHNITLIAMQLTRLIKTGILEHNKTVLKLVFCCPKETEAVLKDKLCSILDPYKYETYIYTNNNHEYHGIHHVWKYAQDNDGIILYFHSKGISRYQGGPIPNDFENCFQTVVTKWKDLMEKFNSMPHINKIGHSYPSSGWIWYNFFFVRASYVREVEEPIITERRHYYEDWLARKRRLDKNYSPDLPEYPVTSENYILSSADCLSLSCQTIQKPKRVVYKNVFFRKL